jgi:hypothetical protein
VNVIDGEADLRVALFVAEAFQFGLVGGELSYDCVTLERTNSISRGKSLL